MNQDNKDRLRMYVPIGLVFLLLFALCFVGFFLVFGKSNITGFVIADNPGNSLSLKLSVKDYSSGHPIEGELLVSPGVFDEDLKLLVSVDYKRLFEFSLKELFDSHNVSYAVKGGKLLSSSVLTVNLSDWNILTYYDFGIYKLKVKASDDSFEDSASFDVIS